MTGAQRRDLISRVADFLAGLAVPEGHKPSAFADADSATGRPLFNEARATSFSAWPGRTAAYDAQGNATDPARAGMGQYFYTAIGLGYAEVRAFLLGLSQPQDVSAALAAQYFRLSRAIATVLVELLPKGLSQQLHIEAIRRLYEIPAILTGTRPIVVTGSDISITPATTTADGTMSAADKTKLNSIPAGVGVLTVDTQSQLTAGSSTWTKPVGAFWTELYMWGSGSSGSGGAASPAGPDDYVNGGGGGGGCKTMWSGPSSALPSTATMTAAAAAAGGAPGLIGQSGADSSFGDFLASGATATSRSGPGISGSSGTFFGGNGNAGNGGAGGSPTPIAGGAPRGGGSGAGLTDTTAEFAGGNGGYISEVTGPPIAGGLAGGGEGDDAPDGILTLVSGSGGGGGGSSVTGNGGDGGNGGFPGGGGGGGGCCRDGFTPGSGGDSGGGAVIVVTYCFN